MEKKGYRPRPEGAKRPARPTVAPPQKTSKIVEATVVFKRAALD